MRNFKPKCYLKKDGDLWTAICIDLCLAAQSYSQEETIAKLNSQISEYTFDMILGDDKEYFHQLSLRKSPLKYQLEYYWVRLITKLYRGKKWKWCLVQYLG